MLYSVRGNTRCTALNAVQCAWQHPLYSTKCCTVCVATPTWQQLLFLTAPVLPPTAQYIAPVTEPSNGLHRSKLREDVTCTLHASLQKRPSHATTAGGGSYNHPHNSAR